MANNNSDKILRICEHLIKISESADSAKIDELDNKINIIMDALGLENTNEENNNEQDSAKVEVDIEEPTENEEQQNEPESPPENNLLVEDNGDIITVGEDLNPVKEDLQYKLTFNKNAKGKPWYLQLSNDSFSFDTIEELKQFIFSHNLPITSRELELFNEANETKNSGKLLTTLYFNIIKE